MLWKVSKPANIALIKYMGKLNTTLNQPSNASLSYTLNALRTTVTLETHSGSSDKWLPLNESQLADKNNKHASLIICDRNKNKRDTPFQLKESEQQRFLAHLNKLKKKWGYNGHFIVRSSNNFPTGCGLASSASSFAALTQCALEAVCSQQEKSLPNPSAIAALSQQGSGSSCRSFFSPWAIWDEKGARKLELPYKNLLHAVVVLSATNKKVSSSQAHQRVLTSPCFTGRPERANARLDKLIHSLTTKDWQTSFNIVWDEFNDMHTLFQTASPAFNYTTPELPAILNYLKTFWEKQGDGPLITMDAGPNIHLLFRPDQQDKLHELQDQLPRLYS